MSNEVEGKKEDGRDEDLPFVSRCRKGDTEAFEILVERHQKKMLNIAYRMLGDYEEACEVVQEAFLSAYKSIGKFRGEARFSTWLYRIVVNHARNHQRQMGARARQEVFCEDDPGEQVSVSLESIEKREVQEKVQECIGGLDAEQREVLVLRDIQGFSYDEIGGILKIPEGTVKSRLFRAREAMRDCLKGFFGDMP
jgi:RNA polymerase sigma-70 factor (ECF subfamily)